MPDSEVDGGAAALALLAARAAPRVAIFDLDRTLLPGSSLFVFGRELERRGLVSRAFVTRHLVTELAFRRRSLDDGAVDGVRATMLAAVAGHQFSPLRDAAEAVGRTVASSAYPTARSLIERHLAAGDFCVIVSASPHELVEAAARALGAHRAVGTRIEVVDGVCTGRLVGPFCYGRAKLERLEMEVGPLHYEEAVAYSDSASDLPLLTACGRAVAVNPDRRLRRFALAAGWPVLRLR